MKKRVHRALTILWPRSASRGLRAIYFDNEGHTIQYVQPGPVTGQPFSCLTRHSLGPSSTGHFSLSGVFRRLGGLAKIAAGRRLPVFMPTPYAVKIPAEQPIPYSSSRVSGGGRWANPMPIMRPRNPREPRTWQVLTSTAPAPLRPGRPDVLWKFASSLEDVSVPR